MAQPLTGVVNNFSKYIVNTDTGRQLIMTPKTDDIAVIAKLCTDYHFFTIVFCAIILLLLFGKVYLRRITDKVPIEKRENLEKTYHTIDELCDNALIFLTVILMGVAIYYYFL